MLVCPECQFENPPENKFCQRCGTSLTNKSCEVCGATVSLDAETCPECGAPTANILLALVFPKEASSPLIEQLSEMLPAADSLEEETTQDEVIPKKPAQEEITTELSLPGPGACKPGKLGPTAERRE
ncbi:MAG: zinc-ribbon domain-containing protein [Kamptonema sp. SIO4C4]|nr:zinc-ribbon domain-containing protein [Kamptonema sp. SIO4C4]